MQAGEQELNSMRASKQKSKQACEQTIVRKSASERAGEQELASVAASAQVSTCALARSSGSKSSLALAAPPLAVVSTVTAMPSSHNKVSSPRGDAPLRAVDAVEGAVAAAPAAEGAVAAAPAAEGAVAGCRSTSG